MTTHFLVPGLLSDARVWRPLGEALHDKGTVVHADVTRDSSIPDLAARLLTETDGPLVVIGHSMGGRVAMEMAHQAPDRARALVLSNTGHGPLTGGEQAKRQAKIDLAHRDMNALAGEWLPPMLANDRAPDPALLADLTEMVLDLGPDVHERQIRALLGRPDAATYLPAITCPVLLMTGAQDSWSPERQHREIADLAPNSALVVIDGAGHFLPMEKSAEAIAAVTEWLKDHEEEIYV